MDEDYEEFLNDERGQNRRSVLAMLGLTGLATVGSALWLSQSFYRDNDPDVIVYREGETYDGDPDGVTYRTEGSSGSWNEVLPGSCNLDYDEKHWLVSRLDSEGNEDLDADNFFDYVEEGRIDLRDEGSELRMVVDQDNDGDYDQGYNIENAC